MLDMHNGRQRAAPPSGRFKTWSWAKRALRLVCAEQGSTVLEMALILPILLFLLLGIIVFGMAFNNQITLTQAATAAAQVAAVSRQATAVDLCNPVNTAITQAAPSLNNSNVYGKYPLSFQIQVDSATVGSATAVFGCAVGSTTCVSACPVILTLGHEVSVQATYGCNLKVWNINPAPNCQLSAQSAEAVQ